MNTGSFCNMNTCSGCGALLTPPRFKCDICAGREHRPFMMCAPREPLSWADKVAIQQIVEAAVRKVLAEKEVKP